MLERPQVGLPDTDPAEPVSDPRQASEEAILGLNLSASAIDIYPAEAPDIRVQTRAIPTVPFLNS